MESHIELLLIIVYTKIAVSFYMHDFLNLDWALFDSYSSTHSCSHVYLNKTNIQWFSGSTVRVRIKRNKSETFSIF